MKSTPGLGPIIKIHYKISQNLDQILRFLKIPQIFWKCVCFKIPWKKSPEFCPVSCTKILRFLSENWSYQQNLRKNPQNLNCPIFTEKSENFLTNFGVASWKKFRWFSIGYFDMSFFQKSENLVQILRNFFENFIDRTKPWKIFLLDRQSG